MQLLWEIPFHELRLIKNQLNAAPKAWFQISFAHRNLKPLMLIEALHLIPAH